MDNQEEAAQIMLVVSKEMAGVVEDTMADSQANLQDGTLMHQVQEALLSYPVIITIKLQAFTF